MATLQAHLKAVEQVLSPGDLAKVIATTPETVSRLRGGRRPRRSNEVAVLTLHAVIDAALAENSGDAAAVRDALLSRLYAPGGSQLTQALRAGDADAALATIGITGAAAGAMDDEPAADMEFDARMAAREAAAAARSVPPPAPLPVPRRLVAARDAVRQAFLEFQPDAQIEERVNPGERPDDEQILLCVSIPGLDREQVRNRLADFRDARWHDLLGELDGDVVVVTR